jgi:hypothetical protein
LRKYIFNFSVLSTLFGAAGLVKTTTTGPRDWRLILMWVSWAISLAIAIGTIAERAKDDESEEW